MTSAARGWGLLLATFVLLAACGSSAPSAQQIPCQQALKDYCLQASSACVMHLQLSMSVATTETSFCTQCAVPCKGQAFAFENCADGSVTVTTQVGAFNASRGNEFHTYVYDSMTFDLTAVLDSTSGGTYKPSVSCLGGQQTVASHGACAPYFLPFTCP